MPRLLRPQLLLEWLRSRGDTTVARICFRCGGVALLTLSLPRAARMLTALSVIAA